METAGFNDRTALDGMGHPHAKTAGSAMKASGQSVPQRQVVEKSGKGFTDLVQSMTAIALISTRQRGSVARRTTCTVVVAGLALPKYSAQTRLSAS